MTIYFSLKKCENPLTEGAELGGEVREEVAQWDEKISRLLYSSAGVNTCGS
jgi:hypothetical protein